ncbi:hypothetical protein [Marinisporobacter balticus]|uniref:ABC transporter family protein n=1 Tax=Marinisporobacter balticus TaxID=2018667 RepID=A0A4R2KH48_9FIRM|nr:hypothetical protein EV214_11623 [Marinisporobacter balticus]
MLEEAGKVREIIEQEEQGEGNKRLDGDIEGEIAFHHITFKYDKKEVIKNLPLTVESKNIVALVGPSGLGKTTLGQLMDKVSFVFQNVFMLHDSIAENIRMGSDKSMKEIIESINP